MHRRGKTPGQRLARQRHDLAKPAQAHAGESTGGFRRQADPVDGQLLKGATGLFGAVGFQVDRTAITRVGTVTHLPDVVGPIAPGSDFWFVDPYRAQISRAIVVSGSLYTLSQAGVKASDLATFATQTFVALAAPAASPAGPPIPQPVP